MHRRQGRQAQLLIHEGFLCPIPRPQSYSDCFQRKGETLVLLSKPTKYGDTERNHANKNIISLPSLQTLPHPRPIFTKVKKPNHSTNPTRKNEVPHHPLRPRGPLRLHGRSGLERPKPGQQHAVRSTTNPHHLKLTPVTDTTRSTETRRGSNTRPRPFASRARRRTANVSVRL